MKTISKNVGMMAITLVAVSLSGAFAIADEFQDTQLEQTRGAIYGHIEARVIDENGNVKQYIQSDNRIVGNGTDTLVVNGFSPVGGFIGSIGDPALGPSTHMQLGIGTTNDATFSPTAIALETATANCIDTFTGVANSATVNGGFAESFFTLSATFDTTDGPANNCIGPTFTEAGLFDAVSGSGTADMFARGFFSTAVVLGSSDSLDVDWDFTFTDS